MQTWQQNEKYRRAGNTIQGHIFSTLSTLSIPTKTKLPRAHAQDDLYVDGKSVVRVFLKEVAAILFC